MQTSSVIYIDHQIEEFIGNPLIEALPPLHEPSVFPRLLLVQPPYSEKDREKPADTRLYLLQRLAQLHVPTTEDTMILLNLSRCLTWGYVSRNPMDFSVVEKALEEKEIPMTDSLRKYLNTTIAPIYGFPVIGLSGVGKTTSVQNALSLYTQVIRHREYRGLPFNEIQLVWLKVDCPGDATPKGLCSAILRGIDEVLKSDYTTTIMKNRMSKDVLLIKVSQLVQKLHLGILIIDDIQNLCGKKGGVSEELLSFMVSMANNLKIPVVMVGTPKVLTLLQREFQQAKRASGEGEIRMDLMGRESPEWSRFIKSLWHYQYTKNRVNLTEEMENTFYEESVGNPFIAATLYKVVQDDAIISRKERFTIAEVRGNARTKMGMTAKMRSDMLNGKDIEMNSFRQLWNIPKPIEQKEPFRAEKKSAALTERTVKIIELMRSRLENGFDEAGMKKYILNAVAANPEADIEVQMEYAMRLADSEK